MRKNKSKKNNDKDEGAPMTVTAGTAVKRRRKLHGLSDVRRYFHRNEIPVYFISATNFNLLGMDEWVKNFK